MHANRPVGFLVVLLLLSGCASVPGRVPPAAVPAAFAHDELDAFLRAHVDGEGRVDYAAAAGDRAALEGYLARVAAASPDSHPELFPGPDHRLAYWINGYNAWVLQVVLAYYPVESVISVKRPLWARILPGRVRFFALQRITLGGDHTTFYTLENRVVRARFREPRVHFALNCASSSCPRLPPEAFRPDRLEAQLERETLRFLNDPRNVEIDPAAGVVRLSSIFDWYDRDFTRWMERNHPDRPATLLGYVSVYREELPRDCGDCRVEFLPYDWALNDRSVRAQLGAQ